MSAKHFISHCISPSFSRFGSSCIDIFVHVACYPETMPMSRIVFYFQNKAVYRVEDKQTDICLKLTFT